VEARQPLVALARSDCVKASLEAPYFRLSTSRRISSLTASNGGLGPGEAPGRWKLAASAWS
jgi:hypothetical protein